MGYTILAARPNKGLPIGCHKMLVLFCCNVRFVMVFELNWKRQMSPPLAVRAA